MLTPEFERIVKLIFSTIDQAEASRVVKVTKREQFQAMPPLFAYDPTVLPDGMISIQNRMLIYTINFHEGFKWSIMVTPSVRRISATGRAYGEVIPSIEISAELDQNSENFPIGVRPVFYARFENPTGTEPRKLNLFHENGGAPVAKDKIEPIQTAYNLGKISSDRMVTEAVVAAIESSLIYARTGPKPR